MMRRFQEDKEELISEEVESKIEKPQSIFTQIIPVKEAAQSGAAASKK
jgi:hypothetical protein